MAKGGEYIESGDRQSTARGHNEGQQPGPQLHINKRGVVPSVQGAADIPTGLSQTGRARRREGPIVSVSADTAGASLTPRVAEPIPTRGASAESTTSVPAEVTVFSGVTAQRPGDVATRESSEPEVAQASERKGNGKKGSWLDKYVTPQTIDLAQETPRGAGQSREGILLEALQSEIINKGPEMDPDERAKLKRFVAAFRAVAFTNMTAGEQRTILEVADDNFDGEWPTNTPIDAEESGEDIRDVWERFGFAVPKHPAARQFLALDTAGADAGNQDKSGDARSRVPKPREAESDALADAGQGDGPGNGIGLTENGEAGDSGLPKNAVVDMLLASGVKAQCLVGETPEETDAKIREALLPILQNATVVTPELGEGGIFWVNALVGYPTVVIKRSDLNSLGPEDRDAEWARLHREHATVEKWLSSKFVSYNQFVIVDTDFGDPRGNNAPYYIAVQERAFGERHTDRVPLDPSLLTPDVITRMKPDMIEFIQRYEAMERAEGRVPDNQVAIDITTGAIKVFDTNNLLSIEDMMSETEALLEPLGIDPASVSTADDAIAVFVTLFPFLEMANYSHILAVADKDSPYMQKFRETLQSERDFAIYNGLEWLAKVIQNFPPEGEHNKYIRSLMTLFDITNEDLLTVPEELTEMIRNTRREAIKDTASMERMDREEMRGYLSQHGVAIENIDRRLDDIKQNIEDISYPTLAKLVNELGLHNTKVKFIYHWENVDPATNIGGKAEFQGENRNGTILTVEIYPEDLDLEGKFVVDLTTLLRHEGFHAERLLTVGDDENLFARAVNEGGAIRFEKVNATRAPSVFSQFDTLSREQLVALFSILRADFASTDKEIWKKWREGLDEKNIPRNTAQYFGYLLINRYLASHLEADAASLATIPSEVLWEESEAFLHELQISTEKSELGKKALRTFVSSINKLRERNERDFRNVVGNTDKLTNHTGSVPLDDELRMTDEVFVMTEAETLASFGLTLTSRGRMSIETTDDQHNQIEATFVKYSLSLTDADKFIGLLQNVPPEAIRQDVITADSLLWVVNDLTEQAELDIYNPRWNQQDSAVPQIVAIADKITHELARLGFTSNTYDSLENLSKWAEKGLAKDWVNIKYVGLLDPLESSTLVELYQDIESIPSDDLEEIRQLKLGVANMKWDRILEIFHEVLSNPDAEELVILMRDTINITLSALQETPAGRSEVGQAHLDEIVLAFRESDLASREQGGQEEATAVYDLTSLDNNLNEEGSFLLPDLGHDFFGEVEPVSSAEAKRQLDKILTDLNEQGMDIQLIVPEYFSDEGISDDMGQVTSPSDWERYRVFLRPFSEVDPQDRSELSSIYLPEVGERAENGEIVRTEAQKGILTKELLADLSAKGIEIVFQLPVIVLQDLDGYDPDDKESAKYNLSFTRDLLILRKRKSG